MKSLALNLSRFRKIEEDPEKGTSTFEHHDNGHRITIAHSALPREQRSYLKSLPTYAANDKDMSDPEETGDNFARGGKIRVDRGIKGDAVELMGDKEKFSDDENVESNPQYKKELAEAFQSKNVPRGTKSKSKDNLVQAFKNKNVPRGTSDDKRAYYDQGTPDEPVSQDDADSSMPKPQASAPTPININVNSLPNPAPSGPMVPVPPPQGAPVQPSQVMVQPPVQAATPQGQLAQTASQVPQATPPPSNDDDDDGDLAGAANQIAQMQSGQSSQQQPSLINPNAPSAPSLVGGMQQQYKGLAQTAQGNVQAASESAQVEDQAAQDRATLAQNTQQAYADLNKERLANAQDIRNNMVDPSKYWDNHSKILTGLGIILSGFNVTNRPNAALEFLNQNMNRDTQAQIANLGARQDILSHNLQQFGNLRAAADFTNVLKSDQLASQLRAASARSQNLVQAGQFNTLAGQLEQQSAQRLLPLAAMQGAMQSMRQGADPSEMLPALRTVQPEMAKSVEDHLFPGEGYSDVPIPGEVRQKLSSQNNVLRKTQNLQNWIDANTIQGALSPAHRGEGESLALELQQAYRQGVGASTSENEQKTINQFISSAPGGLLSAYINDPKLHALSGSMQDSINTIKNQYGFHPFNGNRGAQGQQEMPIAPQPEQQQSGMTQIGGKSYRSVYSPKLGRNVLVPA